MLRSEVLHTHPFNGPLSGTTWVSLYQTTMPAPHHSCFLQAGCPSCRPTNSIKALKASEVKHLLRKQVANQNIKSLSGARCRLAYHPVDACHSLSHWSKIQIGLPFWYRFTRVVLDKGPLHGCVCLLQQSTCGLTCVFTSHKIFWWGCFALCLLLHPGAAAFLCYPSVMLLGPDLLNILRFIVRLF